MASEACIDVVGMKGDALAESMEDFVVTRGLLGRWAGVASSPRDSNPMVELGAGGWGVSQTPFFPGKGSWEWQRIVATSDLSSAESGVVQSS